MSVQKLAVIGGGQMGRALVGGIVASEVISASQVVLVEPDATSRQWWTDNHPAVSFAELAPAVAQCDAVLLAVKPNILLEVIDEVRSAWKDKLVISIAAGIGLDDLSHGLGHSKVARVMPNTPSLVRQGASGYCCGTPTRGSTRAQGKAPWVPGDTKRLVLGEKCVTKSRSVCLADYNATCRSKTSHLGKARV